MDRISIIEPINSEPVSLEQLAHFSTHKCFGHYALHDLNCRECKAFGLCLKETFKVDDDDTIYFDLLDWDLVDWSKVREMHDSNAKQDDIVKYVKDASRCMDAYTVECKIKNMLCLY